MWALLWYARGRELYEHFYGQFLRGLWECTRLTVRCLGKGPKLEKGKDQGGSGMNKNEKSKGKWHQKGHSVHDTPPASSIFQTFCRLSVSPDLITHPHIILVLIVKYIPFPLILPASFSSSSPLACLTTNFPLFFYTSVPETWKDPIIWKSFQVGT